MKTQTNLKYFLRSAITAGAFFLSWANGFALDPCEQNSSMSGGVAATNGGGNHDISGTPFGYEMWTETNKAGSSAGMTYKADNDKFQFKANWSNDPDDLLCRIGLFWGGTNQTTPKYNELDGDIHCDFNFTKSGSGGGYNYIGIYGWTKSPKEVEYYIVENCFFSSNAKQQGNYWNSEKVGSYTMDGDTYELRKNTRTGSSISGNSTFTQIYAVRSSQRSCGHISVSAHMREWEKQGFQLGQLYDCKFLCEVGGGTGSFDLKYGNVWVGDANNNSISFSSPAADKKITEGDEVTFTLTSDTKSPVKSIDVAVDGKSIANLTSSPWSTKWTATAGNHTVKATATLQDGTKVETTKTVRVSEPQAPYKSAFAIPGTVEAEDYDKGGPGEAYYDSDEKNEGDAKYRTDEYVDIVVAGSGMAVGYTTSSEWLEYTIDVEKTSKYNVVATASDGNQDIKFDLYIDDTKVAAFSGSQTADWDTYTQLTETTSEITAGQHILKIKIESNNVNIDKLVFSLPGTPTTEGGIVTPPVIDPGVIVPGITTNVSGNFFDENGAYFGPECEETNYSGAYYTGDYTSPFKSVLGKTDKEIQAKLDQLWNHYFKGDNNSKVYYETSNGEAYILDVNNNDVRSEGMSYGMMICVQTDHKTEFDKLWKWAKNHMWHKDGGQWDGYFAWKRTTSGTGGDDNCAPDGEMYFMTALLFAAHRWNESSYMEDAQYILKSMWKNGNGSLFNEEQMVITFQPYTNSNFSDPSYDLPAFLELFSRWSDTNQSKWATTVTNTRDHLYKSCNTSSGLFSDYNNFDGTPNNPWNGGTDRYLYDAMRCAMNYGMDYYLFGKDATRQETMAKRIIDFFEKDGYKHARFNWDGTGGAEDYTLGETGANAVACYCLLNNPSYKTQVTTNLTKAWEASLMTGQYRYYDGLVHYLSMLHLCGSFKIWKPAPTIKTKTVEGNGSVTYQGVEYKENTTITAFEDCQLYNVTIEVKTTTDVELAEAEEGIVLMPNPARDHFVVNCAKEIAQIELINIVGQTVLSQVENNVSVNLPRGTYLVKVTTTEGETIVKKLQVK